jgi:AraC-like DNA-binding protein
VLSGYNDTEYMQGAIAVGVNDYVMKSADSSKVLNAVLRGKEYLLGKTSLSRMEITRRLAWDNVLPLIRTEYMRSLISEEGSHSSMKILAEALEIRSASEFSGIALVSCPPNTAQSRATEFDMQFSSSSVFAAAVTPHHVCTVFHGREYGAVENMERVCQAISHRCNGTVFVSDLSNTNRKLADIYNELMRHCDGACWFFGKTVVPVISRQDGKQDFAEREKCILKAISEHEYQKARLLLKEYRGAAMELVLPPEAFRESTKRIIVAFLTVTGTMDDIGRFFSSMDGLDKPDAMIDVVNALLSGSLQSEKEIVKSAVQFVDTHYMDRLTLCSIAEHLFISPNYLSHVFRIEMGLGIKEYICRRRITEAKRILAHTDLHYYEIATTVGYMDYKHFSEHFLHYAGMSAKSYQRHLLKQEHPS